MLTRDEVFLELLKDRVQVSQSLESCVLLFSRNPHDFELRVVDACIKCLERFLQLLRVHVRPP